MGFLLGRTGQENPPKLGSHNAGDHLSTRVRETHKETEATEKINAERQTGKEIPREDEHLNPAMPEAEVSHASLLHEHGLPLLCFKEFELCFCRFDLCFCHLQLEVFGSKKPQTLLCKSFLPSLII